MSENIRAKIRAETDRLLSVFERQGAVRVETDILQPASTLLDVYGEDIRARAFTVQDPARGEMILRPDYTVPVVQHHITGGYAKAVYTYAGEVFRRQETTSDSRPTEYIQVGLEHFGGADCAIEDATLFARIVEATGLSSWHAVIGDIGLLIAAVEGLDTSTARKAALRRHIWRPKRFLNLLERFRQTRLTTPQYDEIQAPTIGVRDPKEVQERLTSLAQDAKEPPLSEQTVDLFNQLLRIEGPAPDALQELRSLETDIPSLREANDRQEARLGALSDAGIDPSHLRFEAAYGQRLMEYYDGFVFGLFGANLYEPPLASGGRYDALTAMLGKGAPIPAVGGVIRPLLLLREKESTGC